MYRKILTPPEAIMIGCLERLQQWLREQHVPYTIQHHHQAFTLTELAMELHVRVEEVAKVDIARADGKLVMLVTPTGAQVDLRRVARRANAHSATSARESELKRRFPDCEPGAIPPFGSLYGVSTYVDESLAQTRKLVFRAGTVRDTIKLATGDYLRLAKPVVGSFARSPLRQQAAS